MFKYEKYALMQYLKSTQSELTEAYKRPSEEKQRIYDAIISGMKAVGGKRFRILSHNNFVFSCAYLYKQEGKVYLAVFRPSKTFDVDVTSHILAVQV